MVTHFAQKTNISIGLVCMVNHSAIGEYQTNSTETHNTFTNNDDCPQLNNTKRIVTINRITYRFFSSTFILL